ncbi:MAG: hypothetical protein L3J28_04465 [Candidatus Polarisedimenticolaceae bacterium]|nr:hypothetical protein [Candidatus Polarisedimenticolaceae bacterium]
MINLLLGTPGGGKSYEATVYHILPALQEERLVITNLPLNLDEIEKSYPGSSDMVIRCEPTLDNPRPFSTMLEYGNKWRHPDTDIGPLYVIDEAHMCLPTQGVQRDLEEWYAMHRHEGADVLLLTQSYGKINKSIRELTQLVYRVRKNTALGSNNSYVKKVQDGIRGEVVNTEIRTYKKENFKFYQSHTKSSKAMTEAYAKDIKPIWMHWTFQAAAFFILLTIFMGSTGKLNPFNVLKSGEPVVKAETKPQPKKIKVVEDPSQTKPVKEEVTPAKTSAQIFQAKELAAAIAKEEERKRQEHPLKKVKLHIEGNIQNADKNLYLLAASQNGQEVYKTSSKELIAMGYEVEKRTPCLMHINYQEYSEWLTCDAPRVSLF